VDPALRARGAERALSATGTTKKTGTIIGSSPTQDLRGDDLLLRHAQQSPARAGVPEPWLKIVIEDERDTRSHTFLYKGGIIEFIKHLNQNKTRCTQVLFFEGRKGDIEVEVALQYNDGYQESVFAFANNINTREAARTDRVPGGVDQHALELRAGQRLPQELQGQHQRRRRPRGAHRGGLGAAAGAQFEGQTKAKLGNSDIKGSSSRSSTTSSRVV